MNGVPLGAHVHARPAPLVVHMKSEQQLSVEEQPNVSSEMHCQGEARWEGWSSGMCCRALR